MARQPKMNSSGSLLKESQIVLQICHFLKSKGFFFWVQPQSGFYDVKRKAFRKHSNPYVGQGVPDILLISPMDARLIGIEVKSQTGIQSSAQRDFQAKCHDFNVPYLLVRSLNELKQDLLTLQKRGLL